MSTTIKDLSYLLLEMLNGGIPTDDSKFNYRVAKGYIKNAVAYHLKRKFYEEKNLSEEHYIGNPTTKEVEVKFDGENHYVETLGESIDLGGMRSYRVTESNPNSRWAKTFVPITNSEQFIQHSGLNRIPNVIQYYLSGDGKLVFTNGIMKDIDKVKLTQYNLLPSNDDDSVPAEIGQTALNDAFRLAQAELTILSDRSNDGVPQEQR